MAKLYYNRNMSEHTPNELRKTYRTSTMNVVDGNVNSLAKNKLFKQLTPAILKAAETFNVDPAIIVSKMLKESTFGKNSKMTGAEMADGIGQVSKGHALDLWNNPKYRKMLQASGVKEVNASNYKLDAINVPLAAAALRYSMDEFPDEPLENQLLAYNMGHQGFRNNKSDPATIKKHHGLYSAPIVLGATQIRERYPEFKMAPPPLPKQPLQYESVMEKIGIAPKTTALPTLDYKPIPQFDGLFK